MPTPPVGSPTRLDDEAGTAVFRSDWSADAVQVVALGEHGAAMELGRDREGRGRPGFSAASFARASASEPQALRCGREP